MRKILTVFAIIFCGMWAITTAKAELSDFYTYTEIGAGYKVSLSAGFKVHVNKAWGGRFTSDGYTWRTGDALPNPAPDGMFNGVPVVSMEEMFYGCDSLTSLDLSSFNTSKVTNMSAMFSNCYSLSSLDLSSFNTSNVTNMSDMFFGCRFIPSLDLSSFNTSKVTNMSYMFGYCSGITSLNVSNFNTSNVTNMSDMFRYCESLTSLDLSSFNTSNVTNMSDMFKNCGKATNGKPAVGYAKDAATAAIFNSSGKTGINLYMLKFRAK